MGDALQGVLDGVGEVVHGEDAPLGALAVMLDIPDAVEHRVPHVEVAALQVDLGPEGVLALGELPVLHPLKQVQGLLDGPVPPGGAGGGVHVAPVLLELLRGELAHIGQPLLDEAHRQLIGLFKVVGAVEEPVPPVEAQPVDVLFDGVHKLGILLGRVGVVHAQVADAAELLGRAEVDDQRLAVADVEIAVGLGRKTGMNLHAGKAPAGGDVLRDKFMDKVLAGSGLALLGDAVFQFFRHSLALLSLWWDINLLILQQMAAGMQGFLPNFRDFRGRPGVGGGGTKNLPRRGKVSGPALYAPSASCYNI